MRGGIMVGEVKGRYLTVEERKWLAVRSRNGDAEAFQTLFFSYVNVFKAYIERRLYNHPGKCDAEDILQSTFEKVYRLLLEGKFDPTISFYKYVIRIISSIIHKCRQRDDQERTERDYGSEEDEAGRMGSVPACDPAYAPDIIALNLDLIELICASSTKPHQAVAVFFIKILQWEPREFVKTHSGEKLEDLVLMFIDEYAALYRGLLTRELVRERCEALFEKMGKDSESGGPTGRTTMRSCYGREPASSLSDWCDKVKNHLKEVLVKGRMCEDQERT
jgi:RNA polymerase sigma factor (sigma-70 family)